METSLISKRQFNKVKKFLPVPRGNKKYNNRTVLSAVLWIAKTGSQWRQLPEIFGNWKSIYRCFLRWSAKGIFEKIFKALRGKVKKRNIAMLDSTYVKAHRTAASMRSDGKSREIGRTHGGLTTKIHLLCNEFCLPIDFRITSGPTHDAKAAPEIIQANLDRIKKFIADKAYDSSRIRTLLKGKDICIPPKSNRKNPEPFDSALYRKRHVVENMFAKLKDFRGIAMRYNRCAHTFHSFVCVALVFKFFCVT